MSIEQLVNPHIRALNPYVPGKPIEEVERELGIAGSVKLASNENPLGPSPKALAALGLAAGQISRYPDGASFELRAKLAAHLGVDGSQLVFGSGPDQVLELLANSFLAVGDEVVMPWPSFAMYPIVARGMGAEPVMVPLREDMTHDLSAMAAAVGPRTKIVFLCNPNNPTGTSFGADAFESFLGDLPADVVLAIDEAYFEFVDRDDFPRSIECIRRRPGTIVLRTFSKIYGLAGLRVGYGISDSELIGFLERARHPFNVNRLAEVAALAALEDEEHVSRTREVNRSGIVWLTRELGQLGYEVWPSEANFLMVRTGPGYYEKLLQLGVIVRPLGGFGLDDHIRISIGTAEENERLIKALQKIEEGQP
jgi:histidinol-phosphate aminotransferase